MSEAFPFMGRVELASKTKELPMFREYAWDFEKDTFVVDSDGRLVVVEGDQALQVWIYKAFRTERFQYLAYSQQYGVELKPFIGLVMTVEERMSELERVIRECLLVNPYIRSVDSIVFTQEGDKMTADIELTTIYGEVNINV